MFRASTTSASNLLRRSYSTAPPPSSSASSSNVPLVLALGGLGGLGAWYYMGGFGDSPSSKASSLIPKTSALSKDEFREFTLSSIKKYNHDSSTFTFKLPEGNVSGLNVASAVLCKGAGEGVKDKDGKQVIRPYTPISAPDQVGSIDFLVKAYPNGNLSKHFHELKEGDKLAIKGPIPKFPYKANEFESIGLIAGGSGITPMWQLIQQIASDKNDKTKVTLIYSNKTPEDILLKEEFDRLSSDPRFKILYGVDKAPKNWSGFEGYFTPELGSAHLPAPGLADKIKIFVCGPPPQVEAISGGKVKGQQGDLKGILADLGYQPSQVYKF